MRTRDSRDEIDSFYKKQDSNEQDNHMTTNQSLSRENIRRVRKLEDALRALQKKKQTSFSITKLDSREFVLLHMMKQPYQSYRLRL